MTNDEHPSCKRIHERRRMLIPVDIADLDQNGEILSVTPGHLSDMSQGGIGLITKKLLYDGSKIVVRMKSKGGFVTYGVVVKSSRYDTKHGHCSGCAWLPKTESVPSANKIATYMARHKAA